MVADNDCWEDDTAQTDRQTVLITVKSSRRRDALDRDEDGEVEELCEELQIKEDCPGGRHQDDNDPKEPPRPAEVLLCQVEPAVETGLLA